MKLKDIQTTAVNAGATLRFAQNMQQRRAQLGLSYQDLADRTSMSKSTLQRYETGAIQNISRTKLEALANGLSMSVGQLLGCEDYQTTSRDEMNVFIEQLSCLGYEIETTAMPEKDQMNYLTSGYQLEDDGIPDIVWIRNRRDNKCFQTSWEQLHSLKEQINNFAEFMVNKTTSAAPVIERPKRWYPVDTTE